MKRSTRRDRGRLEGMESLAIAHGLGVQDCEWMG